MLQSNLLLPNLYHGVIERHHVFLTFLLRRVLRYLAHVLFKLFGETLGEDSVAEDVP